MTVSSMAAATPHRPPSSGPPLLAIACTHAVKRPVPLPFHVEPPEVRPLKVRVGRGGEQGDT